MNPSQALNPSGGFGGILGDLPLGLRVDPGMRSPLSSVMTFEVTHI